MVTRYVNPDSSGGNGTTNATSGANAAYASLSSAEAGLPASLADTYEIICETGGSADGSTTTFSGFTADATNYLHVYANTGHRHAGVWNTAKYRNVVSATNAFIFLGVAFTRISYLQAHNSHATQGGGVFSVTAADCVVDSCIGWETAPLTGDTTAGVNIGSAGTTTTVRNSVCYSNRHGVNIHASATGCVIENCTLAGNTGAGMKTGVGANPAVKNTYLHGAIRSCDEGGAANVSWTFTTSAAGDALSSETGLTNSIAHDTTNFTNVTAATADYHLVSGASATLKTGGTDLSGSFTLDIDGETRSDWSIGADEIVSVGGGGGRYNYAMLMGIR